MLRTQPARWISWVPLLNAEKIVFRRCWKRSKFVPSARSRAGYRKSSDVFGRWCSGIRLMSDFFVENCGAAIFAAISFPLAAKMAALQLLLREPGKHACVPSDLFFPDPF